MRNYFHAAAGPHDPLVPIHGYQRTSRSLNSLEALAMRNVGYPKGALVRASGLCLLCNDSGESCRPAITDMRDVEPFLSQGHATFLHSTANANAAATEKHHVRSLS